MIKKKFTPVVLSLSMLLTGCGAVPGMPDIPVVSDIRESVSQAVEDFEENVNSVQEDVLSLPGDLIGQLTGGGKDSGRKDSDKEGKEDPDGKGETDEAADAGEKAAVSGGEETVSGEDAAASESSAAPEETGPALREDPHYRAIPEHYRNRNELKKIASFDNQAGAYDDLSFNSALMFWPAETEGHFRLAGPDGEKVLDFDIDVSRSSYLGGGYYVIAKAVPEGSSPFGNGDIDRNSLGLVRVEGTKVRQVLPCEYAAFGFLKREFMLNSDALDRFVKAVKVESTTTDQKDHLIYFSDKMFSILPDENDYIYNGHWEVFDLAGEAFVPGISSTKSQDFTIRTVGNSILLKKDNSYVLCDAYGNEILPCGEYVQPGAGLVVVLKDDVYTVYDDLGNELFTLPQAGGISLQPLGLSESGFLAKESGDGTEILDRNGNTLFKIDPAWGRCEIERDGVFAFRDSTLLVSTKGEVLAEAPAKLRWLRSESTGYFTTVPLNYSDKPERDTKWVASRDGVVAEDLEGADTITFNFKDEAGNHYVFDTKSFSIEKGDDERMLAPGLLLKRGAEGYYGLYDLFSGETLLPPDHIVLRTVGHMIVAMDRNRVVTTYELLGPGLVKEEFR